MNTNAIDTLGKKLGGAALTLLIDLYPAVSHATTAQQDDACAGMRAKSKSLVDALFDDVREEPWVAHLAFKPAALSLAHEGCRRSSAS
ncbi:MAG: hypothetical protein EXR30_06545 [Betaproteobacteria bacterium]|nr:hypothetical protein [Betaproteobacteria bacterium]MSQ89253.1 hypothetical protein [Betaproteobacteria bacterium]